MIHDTIIAEFEPKSNEYFVKFTPIGSKALDDVYVGGYNMIELIDSEHGAWLHLLFFFFFWTYQFYNTEIYQLIGYKQGGDAYTEQFQRTAEQWKQTLMYGKR